VLKGGKLNPIKFSGAGVLALASHRHHQLYFLAWTRIKAAGVNAEMPNTLLLIDFDF
jgi:hypothetical protein